MLLPWTGVYTQMAALLAGDEPIRLLAADDGYYEIRTTSIGTFCVKRPDLTLETCTEGIALTVPRMPMTLLAAIIERFRAIYPHEHLLNVYWNPQREGFELDVPLQEAGEAFVTTEDATDPYNPERPRVLQVHSHGKFPARFSPTDDADELATGCYGVIGTIDLIPTMAWRFACGGRHVPLATEDLFEVDEGGGCDA